MKVIPRNQTLILANERSGSDSSALAKTLDAASSGGVLKSLTVLASQPDTSVVYVRADYATGAELAEARTADTDGAAASTLTIDSAPTYSLPTAPRQFSSQAAAQQGSAGTDLIARQGSQLPVGVTALGMRRDDYGNPQSARDGSPYLKPAEQYARTQRLLADTPVPVRIDVRA